MTKMAVGPENNIDLVVRDQELFDVPGDLKRHITRSLLQVGLCETSV